MLCRGLYLFASLRRFRKILFGIHLHQSLEIFAWRAKVTRSLEEPATVVDKSAVFIEVCAMLFSCAVDRIKRSLTQRVNSGAEGGSRTRTSFRTTDFKSCDRGAT